MARFVFFTLAVITLLAACFFSTAQAGKVGASKKKSVKNAESSMDKMRLALRMILEKQRTLEHVLSVRTKQLDALKGKKVAKTVKLSKTVRKNKPASAPQFTLRKATKFTRMQAAVKQAQYETNHLRRVLSVKKRELKTLKKKGLSLKTVSRAETSMKDAVAKLKANNFNTGDTQFPEACACQMLPPSSNSKCYYFADKSETTCKYRQCRATFACTSNDIYGLICMRRKKTSKLVVQSSPTAGGNTQCSRVPTQGYVYVPYTG